MTLRALWPVVQQFQAKNGSILTGGKVYIYYQGRTALATTYHDEEGTVVNPNPVFLDSNGRATVFANTIYSYTIVVCDYYGKELFSQDITLHDAISTAEDVIVMGSDGTVKVDTTTLPNGVQYDLSVNTDIINKSDFSVEKKYPVIGDNLLVSDGTNKIALQYEEPIPATQKNYTKYGNENYVAGSAINDEGKVYPETWWRVYYYPCKNGDIINLYVNNTRRLNFGFNSVVPSVGDTIDSYAGQAVLSSPKTITFKAREDGYFLVSASVQSGFNHVVVISETDETIGVKVEKEFLNLYDASSVTWNKYINSKGVISTTSGYNWGVTDFIPFNGKPISFTESGSGSSIPNAAIYDKFYNLVKVVPTGTSQIEYRSEYKFVRINVRKDYNICIKYGITSDLSTYLNAEKLPGLDDIGNGLKKILRGVFNVYNTQGFRNDYEHNKLVASRNSAVQFDIWSQFVNKITSWDGTKIIIEFDLAIPTLSNGTTAGLWVTDGYSSSYIEGHQEKLATFHKEGHYRFEIDTAYYAVYKKWTTFNFWLVYSGITHDTAVDNVVEFSNLFVWCYTEDRKEFNNFNGENLSGLLAGVDAAIDNIVSGQSKTDFIVSPNGTKFIQSIDNSGNIFGIPLFPNKAAFIGNSLLRGNVTFGMNASDSEHDYYHYLTTYITEQNPSAEFVKIYGSPLEHSTTITEARQQIETIVADIPADADLVMIQMGDNVNTDTKREVFNTSCSEFISAVRTKSPKARIIWVGTWYNSTIRSFISNTCASHGVQWVPIGSFNKTENQSYVGAVIHRSESATRKLADVTNVTEVSSGRISVTFTVGANSYISELDVSAWSITGTTLTYTSEYSITDSIGVATHPGDNGFRLIANKILFDTKMSESENTYPAEE